MYHGRISPVFGQVTGSIRFYIASYMANGNHCAKKFRTEAEAKEFLAGLGQLHPNDK